MSEFEGDGLSNQDFEKSLKRFEDMISSGNQQFFDADELEEIIDYIKPYLLYLLNNYYNLNENYYSKIDNF